MRRRLGFALLLLAAVAAHAEDYLDREQFLARAFPGAVPEQKTLWVDGKPQKVWLSAKALRDLDPTALVNPNK